jgi:hypothetical protein
MAKRMASSRKRAPWETYQDHVKATYDFSKLPKWAQEYVAWLEKQNDAASLAAAQAQQEAENDTIELFRRDAMLCDIIYKLLGTTPDDPEWKEKTKGRFQ